MSHGTIVYATLAAVNCEKGKFLENKLVNVCSNDIISEKFSVYGESGKNHFIYDRLLEKECVFYQMPSILNSFTYANCLRDSPDSISNFLSLLDRFWLLLT